MDNCFVLGILSLVGGVLCLLSSLTKTGRNLDLAYLKALPNWMRVHSLEWLRNPMAVVAGVMFIIGGSAILIRAVYLWWTGRPCLL